MTSHVSPFQRNLRRLLRDMHIPDWDERFLAEYDPEQLAASCEDAGLNAVMIYAKSHVGFTTYPTKIGKMHPRLNGRDVLGELNTALRSRGIATSAYTSITFDNWAVQAHPEWAQVDPAIGGPMNDYTRYGVCCPNNEEYRAYELGLLEEILTGYDWDGAWLDMIFFLACCVCPSCQQRFEREEGAQIPVVLDWTDPVWAKFQTARRRWLTEWISILIDRAREIGPHLAITHNLASALSGWRRGQPLDSGRLDDYTSADLYGDRYEQLVATKMALHLSQTQPAELMVSLGHDLIDHVALKSPEELVVQGLASTAVGSAFIIIDGIEPSGAEVPGSFAAIHEVIERLEPYEPYFGGTPIEDVGIYFSDESFVDFADNGKPVPTPRALGGDVLPHVTAVRGAARALAEAHIAFGVITRSDLSRLGDYRVLILPNVSRMNEDEVTAIRRYAENGGRVYASSYTSLVDTGGHRHPDFMLSDLFGVSLDGEEQARVIYSQPRDEDLRKAIWPQETLSQPFDLRWGYTYEPKPLCSAPRLAPASEATVLATLTLPYNDGPDWGAVTRPVWSSIHSAPPWQETERPTVVERQFGRGKAIYSVLELERSPVAANQRAFVAVIERLLAEQPTLRAEARNTIWISLFDQPEQGRVLATLLNYTLDTGPCEERARVTVRAPSGRTFGGAQAGPGARLHEVTTDDGSITVELDVQNRLAFLLLNYA
jgi:hypothetical protein